MTRSAACKKYRIERDTASTLTTEQRFCRAMLCISAAYAVVRCLSVSLADTFVYCVETAKVTAIVAMEC